MQTISARCRTLSAAFIGIAALVLASTAWAVSGAGFTTVDENVDGTGHCQNGNPAVNCNLYDGKQFVWLNGGPLSVNLTAGTYFWAVLAPGGQPNANDNTPKNLSDDCDAATNREFSIDASGNVTNLGNHDTEGNLIRVGLLSCLTPYFADTPNPGGVYILAICQISTNSTGLIDPVPTVDPSQCKYDQFKVKAASSCPTEGCPPPLQTAEIDVFKFCDANANGLEDSGEVSKPLADWLITFNPDPNTCSGQTDATGSRFCPNLPLDTYTVGETVKTGFAHTATCLDGSCGKCSAHPGTGCNTNLECPDFATGETCALYDGLNPATVVATAPGGVYAVDFGNVGQSTISGRKFSDRNANGSDDSGNDPGVQGVKILLSGTTAGGQSVNQCAITGPTGSYSFPYLLPGTYTVTEVPPANSVRTTQTSCNNIEVAVDSTTCEGASHSCNFGNACLGAGGGLTLGFWSNNNGQALLTAADFTLLTGLNLVNANGSARDFTSLLLNTNKSALKSWLLNATATNMAYMLSAQLATMELNVQHGFVSSSALVFAGSAPASCTVPGLNGSGFISISDLMNDANSASNRSLLNNTNTKASGVARTCQEFMKNALDRANNNQNFDVVCPVFHATCP